MKKARRPGLLRVALYGMREVCMAAAAILSAGGGLVIATVFVVPRLGDRVNFQAKYLAVATVITLTCSLTFLVTRWFDFDDWVREGAYQYDKAALRWKIMRLMRRDRRAIDSKKLDALRAHTARQRLGYRRPDGYRDEDRLLAKLQRLLARTP